MDSENRERLIEQHLAEIRRLEAEAAAEESATESGKGWPPRGFYLLWHIVVGMALGCLGAAVSLMANVFGAPIFGRHPLELIRVYLTFPMGEQALTVEDGAILSIGCALYLATGALLGIGLHLIFRVYFADVTAGRRFMVASAIGLVLWVVNFYFILSWLQPLLLDGNWIVSMVPWWVGALTHLAFAWTVAAGEAWGRFEPYVGGRRQAAV